ncbi:MAG: hypothetical protein GKR98_06985 [Boseongicola sp.]|nr:MAG: hypothetical protein GKR98_06985 [Boseongicola sp.]
MIALIPKLTKALLAFAVLVLPTQILAEPSADLIFFTEDGTETGAPLVPGFPLNSIWSGMGQSSDGTTFIAVSNHDEVNGNVAIFALDPGADRMRFVNDLKSVSTAAGNWHDGETQFKVHTFLQQHADGLIYFATMTSNDPKVDRGAHVYTLDPQTEVITDLSAQARYTVARDGKILNGTGVALEKLGIKGMGLNPKVPGLVYFMAYDNGALVQYNLTTQTFAVVGLSARISYVFHVDDEGDVYYLGGAPGQTQSLLRFSPATGETTPLVTGFDPKDEIGMIAPTANPDIVLVLMARSKEVFPLHTKNEKRLRGGTSCGKNWWHLYNMTVSPDGKHVYFVSNNNKHSMIWRAPVGGGNCQQVLDVNILLGSRDLGFGGQNIWDGNSFLTPVWTHNGDNDLAILRVTIE